MASDTEERERRFTELYDRHYGGVYAFAGRRLGREHADEVAAETFLIAWRRFDVVPATPLPWLYGVARNVVARHRAAEARREGTVEAIANELAVIGEQRQDFGGDQSMALAWEQLNARDQEVLALIAWEELSVAEGAAVLGCSAPVFSVRLHRARGRFARLLAASQRASAATLSEVRS